MKILRAAILSLFAFATAPTAFGGPSPVGGRYSASPLVIGGTIVTPDGPRPNSWLVIDNGRITQIATTRPAIPGAKILQTTDLVFPGFVDLHNHPLWAVFPRFDLKTVWKNRYAWRADARYHAALQDPWWAMMSHGAFCDLDEYAELQALMGGTTAITGLDLMDENAAPPACIKGLARNLDYYSGFYGSRTGQEKLAWVLGVFSDMHWPAGKKLHDAMDSGRLNSIAVHTAEGRRDDDEARAEFTMLKSWGLLTSDTAIVHGVALGAPEFAEMAKAGAALIWSPRSNMELYRQMPDLKAAVAARLTIALAPDWAPTGSTNMLAEIAYADALHTGFSQKQLFDMATAVPARIARLDGKIGVVEKGRYADLFLLKGDARDPYKALANARPQDVTLTMVNGQPLYGAPAYLPALGAMKTESIAVCGTTRVFNSTALPKSYNALRASLQQRLDAFRIRLAPLFYCR